MLKNQVSSSFANRRKKLNQNHSGACFILPAPEEILRNPDVPHPFRQESNLYYLTGFDESHCCFVMSPKKGGGFQSTLFVQRRDPTMEMWEGERYGVDRAKKVFGMDEVFWIDEFSEKIPDLLEEAKEIHFLLGVSHEWDQKVLQAQKDYLRKFGRSGKGMLSVKDPKEAIGELRIFKTPEEIEIQKKACAISSHAHLEAMKKTKPGMMEYQVEAVLEYEFKNGGCERPGYFSIVAGGANACCLHYKKNNEELKDGGLLLIDAGGEYDYYTADITRTFPIGKTFSKEQAEIYDLVLESQLETIKILKPGLKYSEIHKKATEVLVDGLIKLGIMSGNRDEIIKSGAHRKYYPHGTGHLLGMDVHDVGLYSHNGESRVLEEGMMFTVEPGLYFQLGDDSYPKKYKGIGIRIEDNILVTKTGVEVMTSTPKTRQEIEEIRAKAF